MFAETLLLAIRAVRRNALRSTLTALGIIIGVAAVIGLVTIGNGTQQSVVAGISKLGSNLLSVRPGAPGGPPGGARSTAKAFSAADAEAIAAQIGGVRAVAPVASTKTVAVAGNTNWNTTLVGTDDDYFQAGSWTIASGRVFTDSETRAGSAVCVIGQTARQHLFGASDPVGQAIRLEKMPCTIIGMLEAKGAGAFGMDQDDIIVVPLRTFQRRIAGNTDVAFINVSAQNGASTAKVKKDVELLLRERRRIGEGDEDDFSVFDMTEITSTLSTTTTVLTGLLGAVAAVSLLVGGIGIMNIMLVSVTERTREIGIRLAVGALRRQVLAQFLVEAIVLSLFGGLIGVAIGLGLASLAVGALGVPLVVEPLVIAGAFVFSGAVGVIFGYFPARRAANLNPIEALRHE
ncbi:MAG TPA: ABC transporter permease [Bauldia sp.]|nr:ABC transporter permease [Bauldia sp.]